MLQTLDTYSSWADPTEASFVLTLCEEYTCGAATVRFSWWLSCSNMSPVMCEPFDFSRTGDLY